VRALGAPIAGRRSGMTLLELLLALSITILTGAAAAAVTLAVSRCMTSMGEGRAVINRANLVQARLRAVTDTAWCVLTYDDKRGLAFWANDDNPNGRVNVSELRILWTSTDDGLVSLERVRFPEGWTEQQTLDADLVLTGADDYFGVMLVQRGLGHTFTQMIGDRLTFGSVLPNATSITDATRLRVSATLIDDGGSPVELLMCLGLPSHRKPD